MVNIQSLVTIENGNPVTTTLAIAKGTEVEHKSVIQLTRSYLSDLEEFGRVTFEMAPFETAGGTQQREIAILNEQQSTLLLTYMRNSDVVRDFKKRLVKAFWQMANQLKAQVTDPMKALSDPAIMRGLLLTYSEKVITLENKVLEQAPKVNAFDRIAGADGLINLQTAGKILQQRPNKFVQKLREIRWIFKRPGAKENSAYIDKINAGYLATKSREYEKPDGTIHISDQVMVTPKGLAKLALVFGVMLDGNGSNGELSI
ncbi:phage regulatory protein/antirepressor Ant [Nitrosomonas sp.]|uniref:Rha family transcriptional regulator n=1 Tax=Nitrosomonas sp. TaxID=42353 RepID=UPI0025EF5301|nr:phage regulatory protein/antirepressor Ant [Nitrosomonas sp.]MBV6447287.1 hypothetical protein [Nitrosomonas sp.]